MSLNSDYEIVFLVANSYYNTKIFMKVIFIFGQIISSEIYSDIGMFSQNSEIKGSYIASEKIMYALLFKSDYIQIVEVNLFNNKM